MVIKDLWKTRTEPGVKDGMVQVLMMMIWRVWNGKSVKESDQFESLFQRQGDTQTLLSITTNTIALTYYSD